LADVGSRGLDVTHVEHDVVGQGGTKRRVLATLAPVRDSRRRALYLFLQVQDVTAQRGAEEELRRSEERFRLLVETVQDYAIFMLDVDGHIASWNAGAQRIKGYRAEDIIGQHFRVFYPPEKQEERHPEHELEWALRDGHYEEEGWRIRKDGSRFWANVVITAIHNDSGEHIGFTKVTRDMTERRRILQQLEAANERLRRAADEQAQFVAVTAHELRTPVGILAGAADTLVKHWDELTVEERAEMLGSMGTSAHRLRRLLSDLLTASRLQASSLRMHADAVNVAALVDAATAGARRTHPDAVIVTDVPTDIEVVADADRLAQALDNVIANALLHGASPVTVGVTADDTTVTIRVSDSGSGVPEAMQPRLFERFVTGAAKGGTGLGLYIVRELARAQGGDATYEPAQAGHPAGSFVITLPRAGAGAAGDPPIDGAT
jgi:PAS domain S-box-containing protein